MDKDQRSIQLLSIGKQHRFDYLQHLADDYMPSAVAMTSVPALIAATQQLVSQSMASVAQIEQQRMMGHQQAMASMQHGTPQPNLDGDIGDDDDENVYIYEDRVHFQTRFMPEDVSWSGMDSKEQILNLQNATAGSYSRSGSGRRERRCRGPISLKQRNRLIRNQQSRKNRKRQYHRW